MDVAEPMEVDDASPEMMMMDIAMSTMEVDDDDGNGIANEALSSVGGGSRTVQGVGVTAVDQLHGCTTTDGMAPHFAYAEAIDVEAAQQDRLDDRILPTNGMSAEPYEFFFNATDDLFVDLNSITQHVELQVVKSDGVTALTADVTDVWPCDNLLASLWKSVEVKFNHTTLHPETASQHGYRAQMEYLLSVENNVNHAYAAGWFGQSEAARKTRFKKRQTGVIDLCGPVALDCLRTTTHLAPNNNMTLTFHKNKDAFILNQADSSNENYRVVIRDVHLRCNRIRLVPSARDGVMAAAAKHGQNYRLSHTVFNDNPVSQGKKAASIRLHNGGVLPNSVIVGMVKTAAFTGDYASDPYKIEHFNLDQIYLRVNGVRHPQDPLKPDFSGGKYARELLHLYQNTGKFRVNGGNSISEADFVSRSFLVPFDLTPDQCNNAHAHASKSGSMELELSFSSALTAGITVVVLSVSNQVMQLDGMQAAPVTAIY